jgi:hypothetical protein
MCIASPGTIVSVAMLQDELWQKRNREAILSAEVGHDERETREAVAAAQQELRALSEYQRPTGRDDSVFSSWFFIEKLHISDINSNVTISLSSNIMATAQLLNFQVRSMTLFLQVTDRRWLCLCRQCAWNLVSATLFVYRLEMKGVLGMDKRSIKGIMSSALNLCIL